MQYYHVPGVSVSLIKNYKLSWARAWGVADADTLSPLTEDHLLHACSMAKIITAMTAAALAQAGVVDLDTDVNQLLTSWKYPGKAAVTLRRLLGHQAGVIDGQGEFLPLAPGQDYPTIIQVLEGKTAVNTKPLAVEREPGSVFAYSDNGYCLAQQVLEDVTGKSLAQLVDEHIFTPLGLGESCLNPAIPMPNMSFSSGHEPDGTVTPGRYPVYPFPGAAGLWCTARDLAAVSLEVQNALHGKGQVLSRAMAEAMVVPSNLPHIGLGNFSQGEGSARQIYHLGWGKGFQCAFLAWPWQGRGAVVMTNSQPGLPQNQSLIGEIFRGLARQYNWDQVADMLV